MFNLPFKGKAWWENIKKGPLEASASQLKNPADRAIIIPKDDGLHLFPIDSTHKKYDSHYIVLLLI